ncbi:MAG: anti-anti-sigma factor [Candidatus Methylumidiphilus alinenensis]|uniref:Anti-anti-sigma factor n=1 Tax=Candidatus Methylumidiphilus alinenensis TaxID=2202197 RepID=A0A2W4TM45_9GAMM|nr:MAG: anti-anti-sigma factor [Candidatus Methylumidiphilus alinenensis]
MANGNISVIKIRDILLVTVPSDPDDCTVSELQEQVLSSMERHSAKGLILDISTVETIDSFFARTVSETVKMVALMGGLTVLSGMRACVAITTTQLGLSLDKTLTALDVDRAMELLSDTLNRSEGRK